MTNKPREIHNATVFAKKRLDNPHVMVCHPEWAEQLTDYLFQRESYSVDITSTGGYGIPVFTDERIPGVAVIEFTEPCIEEL